MRQQWAELQPGIAWHGDAEEFARLLDSVAAHCTCEVHGGPQLCGAHRLLSEQSVLDRLISVRRRAGRTRRRLRGRILSGVICALVLANVVAGVATTTPASHVPLASWQMR